MSVSLLLILGSPTTGTGAGRGASGYRPVVMRTDQMRAAMKQVLGEEKYEYFFDKVGWEGLLSLPQFPRLRAAVTDARYTSVSRVLLDRRGCSAVSVPGSELPPHTGT